MGRPGSAWGPPAPTVYGQQQTFTATVTSASGTPTGSVTFYDNTVSPGTALGTANLSVNGSGVMDREISSSLAA